MSYYCNSVDATKDDGRVGRLLNHRKHAPNNVPKIIEVDGLPRLCMTASKDISVGEQLEYDYGDRRKSSLNHHSWLAK